MSKFFFKVDDSKDTVKDFQGGGDYIGKSSGMFLVKIKHAIVREDKSTHINLVVDYNGNSTTIYRAFPLSNSDGKENEIGIKAFNNFLITCGIKELSAPVPKDIPLGKEGKLTEYKCLEDLEDIEVMLHIKRRFSWYKEAQRVTESVVIYNTFRAEDNASAAEIVNDVTELKQFNKESEFAHKDRLDKEVTQEMVDQYLASKGKGSDEPKAGKKDLKPAKGFGSQFA